MTRVGIASFVLVGVLLVTSGLVMSADFSVAKCNTTCDWEVTGPLFVDGELVPSCTFVKWHIPGSGDDCKSKLHLDFDSAPTWFAGFPNYLPDSVTTGNLVVNVAGSGEGLVSDVKFYKESDPDTWPEAADARGMAYTNANDCGEIREASIKINMKVNEVDGVTYDFNYSSDQSGELSTVLLHEVGHCIGFKHEDSTIEGLMEEFFDGVETFSGSEDTDIACVYSDALVNDCLSGDSPAFFGSAGCMVQGGGMLISLSTNSEISVDEMVIYWAPKELGPWPDEGEYTEIGRIPFNAKDGGEYTFFHGSGESDDAYMILSMGIDGSVHNSLFLLGASNNDNYSYLQSGLDEMRQYNWGTMVYPHWKRIFGEIDFVRDISTASPDPCNLLVVAHEGLAKDVAPLCDFWQTQGYVVEMVGVPGDEVSPNAIKDYIKDTYSLGGLETVLFVGAAKQKVNANDFVNFLPSFTRAVGNDFPYGDVDSDGFLELAFGRIPARSSDEVAFYVNKELRYHKETVWLGKKVGDSYNNGLIFVVPDQYASGSSSEWSDANFQTFDAALDCFDYLQINSGSGDIGFWDTTGLIEWNQGNDALYRQAIVEGLRNHLESGRHLVFGFGVHNSSGLPFEAIASEYWAQGVSLPYLPNPRPCETFWFIPECYINDYICNYNEEGAIFLSEKHFSSVELFMDRGLLVFGPSGTSKRTVSTEIMNRMAVQVNREIGSYPEGHAESIGTIWKEIYNSMALESSIPLEGLNGFCIFGDPMLYVRDVVDNTSDVPSDVGLFSFGASPNPFNGRIQFSFAGVIPGEGRVDIFDVRGRLVKTINIPTVSSNGSIPWDAKDERGRPVASGVYFAKCKNGANELVEKVLFLK
jgi:hypothetical protein